METQLIYLHIEKSAGTSQRSFFKKTLGDDHIFWYGLDSNSNQFSSFEVSDFSIVGGHRTFEFYGHKKHLYTAVMREPIDRVLSLYNYFKDNQPKIWTERGLDLLSLKNTLKNCSDFIDTISNAQCKYISGKGNYEQALSVISSNDFCIGTFESLEKFNKEVCNLTRVEYRELGRFNTGKKGYKDNINLDEETLALLEECLSEDLKFYNYFVTQHNGLFNNVPKDEWPDFSSICKNYPVKILARKVSFANTGLISVMLMFDRDSFEFREGLYIGARFFDKHGKHINETRLSIQKEQYVNPNSLYLIGLKGLQKEKVSKITVGIVDVNQKRWLDVEVQELILEM